MIFVAVGTQFPFDRLIKNIDDWASETGEKNIIAQTGDSRYQAKSISCYQFIKPVDFLKHQSEADLLIGHAGMGTILSALELGKPLIIMPRLEQYGEHRNDHQIATAKKFDGRSGIYVAMNENQLRELLNNKDKLSGPLERLSSTADPGLIMAIREFIFNSKPIF